MERRKILEKFESQSEFLKAKVDVGIENNRKGYGTLEIKSEGTPVAGAKVHLKQKTHEFKYGANIFMLDEMETEEKNKKYREYFKDCFNMATLPFYWSDLEPEKGKPRYAKDSPKIYRRPAPDLCIEYCEENGIEPREHALAYDHFFPKWLSKTDINQNKRELERRFKEISERYADKYPTIEDTNELGWDTAQSAIYRSDDFLTFCYNLADKYFPANELCINEWSGGIWDGKATTRDGYYLYIENTLLKGARIDAVGMQYHMFHRLEDEYNATRKYYDPMHLYRIMDLYAKLNKPLQITEVTIPAYSNADEDEQLQAEIIKYLYSIWFSHPNVEQIIYWNLVDGYAAFAPIGDMTCGENYYYGGLIRHDMTPKPAYYAIKDLFQNQWHTDVTVESNEKGTAVFKGFYGKYEAEITADGKTYTKEIEIGKNGVNWITIEL